MRRRERSPSLRPDDLGEIERLTLALLSHPLDLSLCRPSRSHLAIPHPT